MQHDSCRNGLVEDGDVDFGSEKFTCPKRLLEAIRLFQEKKALIEFSIMSDLEMNHTSVSAQCVLHDFVFRDAEPQVLPFILDPLFALVRRTKPMPRQHEIKATVDRAVKMVTHSKSMLNARLIVGGT